MAKGTCLIMLNFRWAVTAHRTQCQTFDRLVVTCGEKNMPFAGFDYLLFSRVRDLTSIMIMDEKLADHRFSYPWTRDHKFFERNIMEEQRIAALADNF